MNRTYLGAEGAPELIKMLSGAQPAGRIELRPDSSSRARTLVVRTPDSAPEPLLLDRHVLALAPAPRRPVRPAPAALPPGVLVLTNSPSVLESVSLPPDAVVIVTDQPSTQDDLGGWLAGVRHVRVIVDMSDPRLHQAGWSDPAREVLALHERMFLAAKAVSERLESFLVTVLDGVTGAGVPRTFTGLFTGFVKSLALEYPDTPVVAAVHDHSRATEALEAGAEELGAQQFLPVVYLAGGQRLTTKAVPRAAETGGPALTESSVVVAAGGARGIGAPILTALAQLHRPRIVIFGSTSLDGGDEVTGTRADFIKKLVTGPNRVSVAQANAKYDSVQEAGTVRRTLRELEQHCGPGRVTYLRCDLRDPESVGAAVGSVLAEHGDVDLLINIAGTNRASDITTKSLDDFLVVRDLKLRTYLNLKDAFGARLPKRWCNFGSFVGFTGQRGETDYGAANDFLNTAAGNGHGEFTIGWTLWRDIGLGASPVMRSFLAKSNQFTATPTEEGVQHFLAELAGPSTDPATVLFGAKERDAITAALPGYLDFSAGTPKLPFVDEVRRESAGELTVLRTFDLDRDGYLNLHQVDGYPTLPGTFVPELAAEAAVTLVPGRVPVVFENLRLESFLRVYRPDRPEHKRITARLVESDDVESVVEVKVLGDLLAPNGKLLAKDKLHFSVTVRLRDVPTASPKWQHWGDHGSEPLMDPYHVAGSGVLLRDVFESTKDTRIHPLGRRGRLDLDPVAVRRWFPDLIVPSVLLDGLVRVAVLERVLGRWTPVAIPRFVRRIDLYGRHTDLSLAESGEPVELYVTPVDLNLEDPEPDNRAIAVAANGEVLLQVKDIIGAIVGYVDQETGQFVDRKRFDQEWNLS